MEGAFLHKLTIIASHPIQYHSPWYRALANKLDLKVYYAHKPTAEDHAASGFNTPFEWNIPLLDGYPHEWLANKSAKPSVNRFMGCDTPGIKHLLKYEQNHAVLVHGWNLLCYWQTVCRAKQCSLPILVRGDSQLTPDLNPVKHLFKTLVYPFFLSPFDAFLSVGQRHDEYLKIYGVPESKIFRVPHFVDNDFFQQNSAKANRAELRKSLGLGEQNVVFLFTGKLIEKKRPFDFLRALDMARKTNPSVQGLIVGDGPLRLILQNHIREYQTPCVMAGFMNQTEIPGAYAVSDAIVLPSDGRETWGLVVNEAMACGLPVIASNQAGCAPDLVLDERTGFTYPCGDVQKLSQHMVQVANDSSLRNKLSNNSEKLITSFSVEAACNSLLTTLDFIFDTKSSDL